MLYLQHFKPAEFNRGGNWYSKIDPNLLVRMDILRFQIRSMIYISPVDGAVGRNNGQDDKSLHNVSYYGQVRAVDFFAPGANPREVVKRMVSLGFTGIGVYPNGKWNGERETRYHGDTRHDREMGNPAKWGVIDGDTVTLKEALDEADPE